MFVFHNAFHSDLLFVHFSPTHFWFPLQIVSSFGFSENFGEFVELKDLCRELFIASSWLEIYRPALFLLVFCGFSDFMCFLLDFLSDGGSGFLELYYMHMSDIVG